MVNYMMPGKKITNCIPLPCLKISLTKNGVMQLQRTLREAGWFRRKLEPIRIMDTIIPSEYSGTGSGNICY